MNASRKSNKKSKPFYLIFPFAAGNHQLTFRKNKYWNIVDHLILRSIAEKQYTIEELAEFSGIKRQILVQLLIPFLKLGWIELLQELGTIRARITDRGKIISKYVELPSPKKEFTTRRDFLVNLLNGNYIGLINHPNIISYNRNEINELIQSWTDKQYLLIPSINSPYILDTKAMEEAVTQPDEVFLSMPDPIDRSLSINKYLIFNVRSNNTGLDISFHENYLNPIASSDLINIFGDSFKKSLITRVQQTLLETGKVDGRIQVTQNWGDTEIGVDVDSTSKKYFIQEDKVSMVLGGEKHKTIFIDIIHSCKNYLIVHSTFIRPSILNDFLDELLLAVKRGVKVIILWGKDDFDSPTIKSQELKNLDQIRTKFRELYEKYDEKIILHNIQTGSHSKYILWDTDTEHCTLIGSCNWFFSGYNRYEASVLIKDNSFTREMVEISASLSTGAKLTSNYLSRELLVLAGSIRHSKEPLENTDRMAEVCLLHKGHHLKYIQNAKQAKIRVTLLSDKITPNLHRSIWDTLSTCNVKISAFYSSVDKDVFNHNQVNQFSQKLAKESENIILKLHSPPSGNKNHSKVLAWDKNHIVISSLNWMSSDASGAYKNNDIYHELGVYILKDKIEQEFHNHFFDNLSHE